MTAQRIDSVDAWREMVRDGQEAWREPLGPRIDARLPQVQPQPEPEPEPQQAQPRTLPSEYRRDDMPSVMLPRVDANEAYREMVEWHGNEWKEW